MRERENIRLFLTNGFKFEGIVQPKEPGFITILDTKTHSIMKFPLTSVNRIEVLE